MPRYPKKDFGFLKRKLDKESVIHSGLAGCRGMRRRYTQASMSVTMRNGQWKILLGDNFLHEDDSAHLLGLTKIFSWRSQFMLLLHGHTTLFCCSGTLVCCTSAIFCCTGIILCCTGTMLTTLDGAQFWWTAPHSAADISYKR